MNSYLPPFLALIAITGTLFFVDYQNENPSTSSFFLTSIIQDWLKPTTITDDLLAKTSLREKTITEQDSPATFFSTSLMLPEKTAARRYSIADSSIAITEIQTADPLKTVQTLLQQQNPEYEFNQINEGTFYLNQIPLDRKTHNFLGIVIQNVLYGFQYLPKDHPKVLEIIDALEQTE